MLVVVVMEAVVVIKRGTGAPGSNGVSLGACGDDCGGCRGGGAWRRERSAEESDESPVVVVVLVLVLVMVKVLTKRSMRNTRELLVSVVIVETLVKVVNGGEER